MKHLTLLVIVAAACSKKASEEPPSKPPIASLAAAVNAVKAVAAVVEAKPAAATEPAGPPATGWTVARTSPRPWIDEVSRGGMKCEFVKWDGTGPERTAKFKITVPGHGASHGIQTKIFYYDHDEHYAEEFPHFISGPLQPLTSLGLTGTGLKDNMVTAECEIDSVVNEQDHTFWFNHNLSLLGRPKGGFAEGALKEHAGEHLTVEVVDAKKGKVKLKNTTAKAITGARLWLLLVKDGKAVTAFGDFEAKLAAGAAVDQTLELKGDGLEEIQGADPKEVEAWAATVYAEDGMWQNENLNLYSFRAE